MIGFKASLMLGALFAVLPASTNYQLHNYGYGSGGTSNATSTNYSLNATTGETGNRESSSTNYKARSGTENSQQAHVPSAPTFTNPSSYYNKLRFIITPSGNPSDTLFSIAISSDGFTTTQYVQSDNTVGNIRGIEDYQSYTTWGGAAGQLVSGLSQATTYQIKVNAFQGKFSESEYGPSASAATVSPSITFDIDVAATNISTSPPYATSFGSLLPATVVNTPELIWVSLDTNADSGAKVYISSLNGGLNSATNSFTLTSASADLAAVGTGYGGQVSSVTQSSGGPLASVAPYNGSTQNVGILNSTIRELFSTSVPITAGRGSVQLKAKAATQTPSAADYRDVLTLTAAAAY